MQRQQGLTQEVQDEWMGGNENRREWEGLGGNRREGIGGTDWEGGNRRESKGMGGIGMFWVGG